MNRKNERHLGEVINRYDFLFLFLDVGFARADDLYLETWFDFK